MAERVEENSLTGVAAEGSRLHALDSLRAVMMLLGVILHASLAYTVTPLDQMWPFKDERQNMVFDALVFLIHIFRMPIFFMVAGFFARLLYGRLSTRAFLRHRAKRILLPLLVAWVILYVPVSSGFIWVMNRARPNPTAATLAYYRSSEFIRDLNFLHLWFLYYLLFFYLFVVVCVKLAERPAFAKLQARVDEIFRRIMLSAWRPLAFIPLTLLTLLPMESGGLDTPSKLYPQPSILLAYGLFFAFGWLLYRQADLLQTFRRHAWRQLFIALALVPFNLYFLLRYAAAQPAYDMTAHLLGVLTSAVTVWLMLYSITGLFVRYMNRPSRRWRYLADSSYWLYIMHLPLMVWLPVFLSGLPLPALLKFALVIAISLTLLLLSYQYLVRYTIIGEVLNGKRERERSLDNEARAVGAVT